jgi:2-phospho-L-lactate guanylyltransferase (CobY/MobA/RfbA family)
VVLSPDRQEDGTNAMLVVPPGLIPFAYGMESFRRHRQLAEEAGATVKIYHTESLALDIDTPEDLILLDRMETNTTAQELASGK